MVNFNSSKADHDGFVYLNPKLIFQQAFNADFAAVYDSEFAFYGKNYKKKIEAAFPDVTKQAVKRLVDKNKRMVETEVVYTSLNSAVVIAVNQFIEVNDYAIGEIDIDDMPYPDLGGDKRTQARITIYALASSTELERSFKKLISKDNVPKSKKGRELNIICHSPSDGIFLKSFRTNKTEISITENYNDDFAEVSNNILSKLSNKNKNGIVLFHSEPGCGKTTYLRYLTQRVTEKRLIYMPPDMTHRLAEPDFMAFLMDYPDSILIIEDAENCLQKRDGGGNQAVSNLLNSSDGLLGDALKLQIVCTFNCDIALIDPALLRPGRLIAEYKFEKLSRDKAIALAEKLYAGSDTPVSMPTSAMTLADIYNLDQKKFKSQSQRQAIGFNK